MTPPPPPEKCPGAKDEEVEVAMDIDAVSLLEDPLDCCEPEC